MMEKFLLVLVAALSAVGTALVIALIWHVGATSAHADHCREQLGGQPMRTGFGGELVCVKSDAILKRY